MYHFETYQLTEAERTWDLIKRKLVATDKKRYIEIIKKTNFTKLQRAWIIGTPFLVVVLDLTDENKLVAIIFITQQQNGSFVILKILSFGKYVDIDFIAINREILNLFDGIHYFNEIPDISDELHDYCREKHDKLARLVS